ncbi:hypothetical protein Tco_1292994 [Tanacetum coccineum]
MGGTKGSVEDEGTQKAYLVDLSRRAWSWDTPQEEANASVSYPTGTRRTTALENDGWVTQGNSQDDIEATPSGISKNIVRVTFSGAPEDTVGTPLGNVSPIHLSFDDGEDRTRVRTVVTGKEIMDADLKRPLKLYDRTTNPEDHLSRFSSVANSGEWPMPVLYIPTMDTTPDVPQQRIL